MKISAKSQLGLNVSKYMVTWILTNQYTDFIEPHKGDEESKLKALREVFTLFSEEIGQQSGNESDKELEEKLKVFDEIKKNRNLFSNHQVQEEIVKAQREADRHEEQSKLLGKIINLLKSHKDNGLIMPELHHNVNYLMADTALHLAQKIKIDENKFDIKFLAKVREKKVTFLLGKNKFIRFINKDGVILAICVSSSDVDGLEHVQMNYTSFKLDTNTGQFLFEKNPPPSIKEKFKLFVQLLIFTELSELEIKLIKPGQKIGTKKEGNYLNGSNKNVTIVDSTWNKLIVRTEGFEVSGHFRLQPCGLGMTDRRLVFISPFQKFGYVRRPKGEFSKEEIDKKIENENNN